MQSFYQAITMVYRLIPLWKYKYPTIVTNNCYVPMDNASIHNDYDISMILAPYSYDLNPIELVLALAKSYLPRNPGFLNSDDMVQAIADVFLIVNRSQVQQFYPKLMAC